MHTYQLSDVSPDMSFLEMLDVLNEELNAKGEEPIAFDSDCREGICGMCGLMINGDAHGPEVTTTCQLHMRSFSDGETITIEPWRATAFPVIKDLVVDRGAFDRIIQQGGYISVNTGLGPRGPLGTRSPATTPCAPSASPPASAAVPAWRPAPTAPPRCSWAPRSPTSASCPQGQPERDSRVVNMVAQHDHEGFGGCTNIGECTAACPKEIPLDVISPAQQGPAHRDHARSLIRSASAAPWHPRRRLPPGTPRACA